MGSLCVVSNVSLFTANVSASSEPATYTCIGRNITRLIHVDIIALLDNISLITSILFDTM